MNAWMTHEWLLCKHKETSNFEEKNQRDFKWVFESWKKFMLFFYLYFPYLHLFFYFWIIQYNRSSATSFKAFPFKTTNHVINIVFFNLLIEWQLEHFSISGLAQVRIYCENYIQFNVHCFDSLKRLLVFTYLA